MSHLIERKKWNIHNVIWLQLIAITCTYQIYCWCFYTRAQPTTACACLLPFIRLILHMYGSVLNLFDLRTYNLYAVSILCVTKAVIMIQVNTHAPHKIIVYNLFIIEEVCNRHITAPNGKLDLIGVCLDDGRCSPVGQFESLCVFVLLNQKFR